MPAAKFPIYIEQGAEWNDAFSLVNDDDGTPFDLTNFSGKMQIRETTYSTEILAEVTIMIPTPTNGQILRSLTAAQTKLINVPGATFFNTAKYVYDFYLISADGHSYRILNDVAEISGGVTR